MFIYVYVNKASRITCLHFSRYNDRYNYGGCRLKIVFITIFGMYCLHRTDCTALVTPHWLHCTGSVLATPHWLHCTGYTVLATLDWLHCTGYTVLATLSWLHCPGYTEWNEIELMYCD